MRGPSEQFSSSMNSKRLVFIAIIGTLGNVFSGLSILSAPLIASIPLGPVGISLAFDLSHISTFIGAFIGGPIIGGAVGLIGGIVASYQFGFSQGNLITGFGLPLGKAITGVTAGLLISKIGIDRKILAIPITIMSYIPEAIYTAFLFLVLFPPVFHLPLSILYLITAQILVKAFIEMVIIGLILSALLSNKGFKDFTKSWKSY